jgi:hypothetical protein
MTSTRLSENALRQFTGTDTWHRHGINRNVLFTDGAKFVADEGGAYWLIDAIAICQMEPAVKANPFFQTWKLTVHSDRKATLVCGDGDDNVVYTQEIPYTDFPLDEVTLWFANDVIHLPSEY